MIKIKLYVMMSVFLNIVDPVLLFGVERYDVATELTKRAKHNKELVKRLRRGKGFLEDTGTLMAIGGVGGAAGHFALTSSAINSGNTSLAMILGASSTGGLTGAAVLMSFAFTAGGVMAAYPVAKTIERAYQKYQNISPPKFEKRYSAESKYGQMLHSSTFRTKWMQQKKRKQIEKTELFDEIMIMLAKHQIRSFKHDRFTFDYGLMFDHSFSHREKKRLQKHREKKRQLESVAEIMAENLAYIKNKEQFLRENFENCSVLPNSLGEKDKIRLLNIRLIENLGVSRHKQHLIFYWRLSHSKLILEKRLEKVFSNQLIVALKKITTKIPFSSLKLKNNLFSKKDVEAWPHNEQSMVLVDKENNICISNNSLNQLISRISKYAAKDLARKPSYGLKYYWDSGKIKNRESNSIVEETDILARAFDLQIEPLTRVGKDASQKIEVVLDLKWKAF